MMLYRVPAWHGGSRVLKEFWRVVVIMKIKKSVDNEKKS